MGRRPTSTPTTVEPATQVLEETHIQAVEETDIQQEEESAAFRRGASFPPGFKVRERTDSLLLSEPYPGVRSWKHLRAEHPGTLEEDCSCKPLLGVILNNWRKE